MMAFVHYAGWLLILFGHVALWIALLNRAHALRLPCWVLRISDKVLLGLLAGLAFVWCWWGLESALTGGLELAPLLARGGAGLLAYATLCSVVGLSTAAAWAWRRAGRARPAQLISNDTATVDVARELGHAPVGSLVGGVYACLPGNQSFQLHINEKTLKHPGLPPSLSGLTITHLTDLHFCGKISRSYFDYVVDRANQLESDVVAVTGDILDKARYLDWIPLTLGRLQARGGVYCILGNHDWRLCDTRAVRRAITEAGLTDLGGGHRWLEWEGSRILLAGNELPWFGPPPAPEKLAWPGDGPVFRILLSHSPDQLGWARQHGFQLMLAGHTHGGQIRFPLVGPILTPSWHGVKYASGVFYEPPTLMHVSRGISAVDPLRLNCPPELTRLVLT